MAASSQQQKRMFNLIRKYQSGNLSVTEFCEKNKVHKWTFWYWRKKLAQSIPKRSNSSSEKIRKPKTFLLVKTTPQLLVPGSGNNIEIHFPSGIKMVFPESFDLFRLSCFLTKHGGQ